MIENIRSNIDDPATKSEWTNAANNWRLPYWDWALPQADTGKFGVPKLVGDSEVMILKLGEREEEKVLNPLYKFTNKVKAGNVSTMLPMGDPKMGKYAVNYKKVPNVSYSNLVFE
jgi:tyrosinase